jgi:hypothetical protein
MSRMESDSARHSPNVGTAWLLLCFGFVCHAADEALTGFLEVYNPTVLAVRASFSWFPMPTYAYRDWLIGLIVANLVMLALTPLAYRNSRGLRPLAYFFAGVMLLNGLGHTLFTILGHTVPSITFRRPAPGFYSSPLLLVASVYLFARLRATRATHIGKPQRTATDLAK